MGFPQESYTVRFNSEPKRYKSVSLSAKRSVFTLVGLAYGVVTEKLRFPYKPILFKVTEFRTVELKISRRPGGGHGKPLDY